VKQAMGEALTLTPGKGAIATFAPAGLSTSFVAEPAARAIYGAMFGADKVRRVGQVAAAGMGALYALGHTLDLIAYQLVGDPATKLSLPAPSPPTDPSVVGGNGVVGIAWTQSVDAVVGYRVYRTENLLVPYTLVATAPSTSATFDDTTVINGTTYYYILSAVDAGGFESALSNKNTDCGVSGPDCLEATPINLTPPVVPSGVGAESVPGGPDRIRVFWDPQEPDIGVFRVHYGTTSGVYPAFVEVAGSELEATVAGLTTGTEYFFVVEAENTSGILGPRSTEVSAAPQLFIGIRPPATVTGLQVEIAPGDPTSLDLNWDPVTEDIYGGVTTVNSYEIYRGTTPPFVTVLGAPWATVLSPTTTYRDLGAVAEPTALFYLIVAVDNSGFYSGIGRDLPGGVLDLQLGLQGDGQTVDLSWPAVSTTVSGQPTVIDHYEIHGSAMPLSRAQISPSTLLGTTVGTFFSHLPPGGQFFYTVIAVDRRGAISPF
jgi:Peptidase family C25/Fibronectin type III domain